MTLTTLVLYIGIAAFVLTLLIGFLKKGHRSWIMTFLQNFTGVLFVFSGWVKAIDPMGTAFKMEQYFAEFESTLEPTWFGFLAPVFPWLSEQAIWFSVFMIFLEIVVGVLLIIGHKVRLTSWIFLIVIVFFTALTGFTFLTGYVPPGENFFSFSRWVPYAASNMRVTDCGCFGDFIKLEPRTSFFKDLVLLIPALIFVFRHRDMHQLFTARVRNIIALVLPVVLLFYCLSNFLWDEPHMDFRPFKTGVNVAAQKAAEEEAQANIEILSYKLRNKTDSRVVELDYDVYMKEYKSYPKDEWDVIGQKVTEPAIPETKISHFDLVDLDGNDVTADILENPEPVLLIVCYKLKGEQEYMDKPVSDSIYVMDSVQVEDSLVVVRRLQRVDERMERKVVFDWDDEYMARFREKFVPLAKAARARGMEVHAAAGGAGTDAISSFLEEAGADFPMHEADDVMLKTIMRSNPGLVLFRDGVILGKWHHKHLPDIEDLVRLSEQH